jgi:hypothetical protein
MASAFEQMGQGIMNRTNFSPAMSLGMMLADTAVGFGGSVALGEVYGRYAEKSKFAKYSPEILGGVGKMAEALLLLFVGPGFSSGVAGSLGQVGVNAIGLELGLNHARKSLGVVCAKVPAGTDLSKLKSGAALPAGSIAVGALPAADAGRGLSWDHIQELAHSC